MFLASRVINGKDSSRETVLGDTSMVKKKRKLDAIIKHLILGGSNDVVGGTGKHSSFWVCSNRQTWGQPHWSPLALLLLHILCFFSPCHCYRCWQLYFCLSTSHPCHVSLLHPLKCHPHWHCLQLLPYLIGSLPSKNLESNRGNPAVFKSGWSNY